MHKLWTYCFGTLIIGLDCPFTTGILSDISGPKACTAFKALIVVFSTVWLPPTVETPINSMEGLAHIKIAKKSSCPGSQSCTCSERPFVNWKLTEPNQMFFLLRHFFEVVDKVMPSWQVRNFDQLSHKNQLPSIIKWLKTRVHESFCPFWRLPFNFRGSCVAPNKQLPVTQLKK